MNSSSSTNITDIEYGGIVYFLQHISLYLPYSIICSLAVLSGIIGNSFVMISILINKELKQNPTFMLIFNLALADIVINLIVDTFSVIGIYLGKVFFDRQIVLCYFVGSVCLISCGTALLTMALLALNRYISVFYHLSYHKIFKTYLTILLCALTWIVAFVLNIPNLVGWGDIVYDLKTLTCVFDRLKRVYVSTFTICCIFIPCILIAFCYIRIFWHWHANRAKIQSSLQTSNSLNSQNEKMKLAKCLFASFSLFAICWIPVGIIFLFGLDYDLHAAIHLYSTMAAHINSALNPIFYGIFNPKIRDGYKKIVNKIAMREIYSNDLKTVSPTPRHLSAIPWNNRKISAEFEINKH